MPSDPGNCSPVVEPDDQIAPHVYLAPPTFDDTHDIGLVATHRHEVDHRDDAAFGLENGLQDQGVIPISTVDSADGVSGRYLQRPLSRSPNSAAKQAAESNRGKQAQSMDPSLPTSAAV